MTADQPSPEPVAIADAIPPAILKRLKDMGLTTAAELPPTENTESAEDKAERLETRRQVYAARWAAQVPPMYADADLANLSADQAFTWPQDSLNLVLAGNVGTGKTYAAYALGHALVRDGNWVQATTVADLLASLRPDGDPSLGRAYRQCGVLILDDLGATKASDWAVEQMTALLDYRLGQEKRTIVTTNVPEAELEAAWGGRFTDRLRYRRTVQVFRGTSRRVGAW